MISLFKEHLRWKANPNHIDLQHQHIEQQHPDKNSKEIPTSHPIANLCSDAFYEIHPWQKSYSLKKHCIETLQIKRKFYPKNPPRQCKTGWVMLRSHQYMHFQNPSIYGGPILLYIQYEPNLVMCENQLQHGIYHFFLKSQDLQKQFSNCSKQRGYICLDLSGWTIITQ